MIRSLFAGQNCVTSVLTNDFAGTLLHRVPTSIIIIPLFLQKVKKSMAISQIFLCLSLSGCQTIKNRENGLSFLVAECYTNINTKGI